MKNRLVFLLCGAPFALPFIWRMVRSGLTQPLGLLSDLAFGILALFLFLASPRWLRIPMILLWALFQAISQELFAAMHRLPNWQDARYLFDQDFVRNTVSGLHLDSPVLVTLMVCSALLACWLPLKRPGTQRLVTVLTLGLGLVVAHGFLDDRYLEQNVAARYNPLQWFLNDTISIPLKREVDQIPAADLPPDLKQVNLNGAPLLRERQAKNVLIIVLEGIPGLYYPAIREAMGVPPQSPEMPGLAQQTRSAMVIPDFVTHSHQTIRGLYSILCGDVSELSFKISKAVELVGLPEQARNCLPAQMAENGWDTHYLQAANLAFMSKDRVMPAIGFREVHGSEWFPRQEGDSFAWGATDSAFFRGAKKYITGLRAKEKPWLLTMLTVGTHQPYSVPDAIARNYPSRKDAAVALLDRAVSEFLQDLRRDGMLDDTLVFITSDESHGHSFAEWVCSWGLGVVLVPEQDQLPRLKQGTFALMDITASILDYFMLDIPPGVIGRSIFRDYNQPREMVSYTAGKLRWHTSQDLLYECSPKADCLVGTSHSLLGTPSAPLVLDGENTGPRLFAAAAALDNKLLEGGKQRQLRFASGEIRPLPEKVRDEWIDNLIGAQYLDFPANSKIHVSIRVRAVRAPAEGIQLKLSLRQWEQLVTDIPYSEFPLLLEGEESAMEFAFDNPIDREAFSFHLTGEGRNSSIQIEEFNVTIL